MAFEAVLLMAGGTSQQRLKNAAWLLGRSVLKPFLFDVKRSCEAENAGGERSPSFKKPMLV